MIRRPARWFHVKRILRFSQTSASWGSPESRVDVSRGTSLEEKRLMRFEFALDGANVPRET